MLYRIEFGNKGESFAHHQLAAAAWKWWQVFSGQADFDFFVRFERAAIRRYEGLEWVSPPQWRIGHTLDLAGRPNELRNVNLVYVQ